MNWQTVIIKPLSVNEAWRGRRQKSVKYLQFQTSVMYMLKKQPIPEGKLTVELKFYFSSKGSDIDNPVKMVLDILQKKYGLNDNKIYALNITKEIVPKGQERFKFKILPYNLNN